MVIRRALVLLVVWLAVATAAPLPALAGQGIQPFAFENGALWGAHVQDAAGNVSQQGFETLEKVVGRKLAIDHYYRRWATNFPDGREKWNFANGRIPMISWGKASTAEIVAGQHDALIRTRAQGLRDLKKPVFLRWFWEMDGIQNGEGPDFKVSPADYIAAWNHLRDVFIAERATNVVWVWCPNAWGFTIGKAAPYYPGDDKVDWICADGYNWYPAKKGSPDESFERVFKAFYDWAKRRPKPIMIGEWGAQENGPGVKAKWLLAARDTVKKTYPQIAALVYFNHTGHPGEGDTPIDWRIETSPESTAAFATFGADPYFNPTIGASPPVPPAAEDPPPVVPEATFPALMALTAAAIFLALRHQSRRPTSS